MNKVDNSLKSSIPDKINVKINDEIKIKDKPFWKDTPAIFSIFSILIAIAALLISINIHSPFHISVYTPGAYVLLGYPAQDALSEPGAAQSMEFIIPMDFINTGNQPGFVEDVYFILRKDNYSVTYNAKYEIDLNKLNTKEGWQDLSFIEKPFIAFVVSGKEGVSKTIMFMQPLPGPIVTPSTGNYSLDIYIKSSARKQYVKTGSIDILIEEDALQVLLNNNLIFFRTPRGFDFKIFNQSNQSALS